MADRLPMIVGQPGKSSPNVPQNLATEPLVEAQRAVAAFGGAVNSGLDAALAVKRIKDAKQEMMLRERLAELDVSNAEALAEAEQESPSDADIQPGSPEAAALAERPSLEEAYGAAFDRRVDPLREGLDDDRLRRFELGVELSRRQGNLSVNDLQRQRDIDGAWASLERLEETLETRAEMPGADTVGLIAQYREAADAAFAAGLLKEDEAERAKIGFENRVTEKAKASNLLATAQARTDFIMGLEIPKAERLKMARAIDDPELRKEVESMVEHRSRLDDAQAEDELGDVYETMATEIEFNGKRAKELPGFDELPPAEQRDLLQLERDTMAGAAAPRSVSDEAVWMELWERSYQTPESFRDMNLRPYRRFLTRADYAELRGEQTAMKRGQRAAQTPINTSIFGAKGILVQHYGGQDAVYEELSDSQKRQVMAAMHRINKMAMERGERAGEALTVPEQAQLAEIAIRQSGVSPGVFFPDTERLGWWPFAGYKSKALFDLEPHEARKLKETKAADLPPELAGALRTMLMASPYWQEGDEPTPEEIEDALADFIETTGLDGSD